MTGLADRLRDDLGGALRRRDMVTVRTLRTVLSSIANAEAVPVATSGVGAEQEGPIAGAFAGLGSAEAPRRVLSDDDVRGIVSSEREELLSAAETTAASSPDRASQMRAAAELLASYL